MLFRVFRKAWAYLVGAVLLAWGPIKFLLEWAGTADLIITHIQEPGWMGDVIEWLLRPAPWAPLAATALGVAVICWQLWRTRRHPPVMPAAEEETEQPAPPARPVARAPLAEVAAPSRAQAKPQNEPDWGKLYAIEAHSDGRRVVRLRFLPDTRDQQDDTALLVVLGYKAMLGRDWAFAPAVNFETQRALHEAPNSRITPLSKAASLVQRIAQPIHDYGNGLVEGGLLRRERLAQGGYYGLTPAGEQRARELARDLIRRA